MILFNGRYLLTKGTKNVVANEAPPIKIGTSEVDTSESEIR